MKALTLTQPWATLVAIGAKRIETRSWQTAYRGPLAIHAAKGFPKWARDTCTDENFWEVLMAPHLDWERTWLNIPKSLLPLGCVIATCQLIACKFITSAMSPGTPEEMALRSSITPPPEPERSFGDYETGRYAWILEDVQMLQKPIPAKGALSLWEWETGQQERKKQA